MTTHRLFATATRCVSLLSLISLAASLGCGREGGVLSSDGGGALSPASANAIRGNVHGGQQPVSNAQIQLWAVGTNGDGSASQPLLSPAASTDANGNFSITGDYSCPSSGSLVYLTATGGNPGLPNGGANNNLALMTALGPCGSLTSSTFVTINEVTTVGAVMALHPYMLSYSAVGSGSSDATALATAFGTAGEMVNVSSGTAGGPNIPAGYSVDTTLINTLADILANCVNSAGGVSGDSSTCGKLFALTGGAATKDTIAAGLYIANNPTSNVSALFQLLTPNEPFEPAYTFAPSSFAVSITTNAASNYYAIEGQQFLLQVQQAFLQPSPARNFTLPLYAGDIDPLTGKQLAGNAPLFSQENMVRALYWGAQVSPTQFTPLLSNAVNQLAWNEYQSAHGECFGTTANATCFFDDNAQLAGTLMNVYLHVLPTAQVYADSSVALNYVLSNTDAQGGIPQTPSGLGQGNFYMNPVVESGQTEVNYGTVFNNSSDVAIGLNYFNEVNNPALGLINKGGLFIGGTTYDGNGQWTPNNVGPLAGESANVSELALALYRNTGNTMYLTYAENLVNLMAAKWVVPTNGAVSQDAVNGGYALVDVLCQLYETDHNVTYFNEAKSIVDFILNNNRDTAGYFSNGTNGPSSDWNSIRTGQPPDADTTLLTQSAAAAAVLEFAYIELNYPPTLGSVNLQASVALTTTSTGYSETLTVTNMGTAVAPTILVTSASLGAAAGATLPALLGDLQPNQSASVTLTFPASAGADNTPASESVAGTYSGGTFSATLPTTLP